MHRWNLCTHVALLSLLMIVTGLVAGSSVKASAPLVPLVALGSDCNDTRPGAHMLQAEIGGNRIDDDCDGLADEDANNNPSSNSDDADGDGMAIASGDCDDTNAAVRRGIAEVAGNLMDDNCNGLADEDAFGNLSANVVDLDGDGYVVGSDRLFRSGFESLPPT